MTTPTISQEGPYKLVTLREGDRPLVKVSGPSYDGFAGTFSPTNIRDMLNASYLEGRKSLGVPWISVQERLPEERRFPDDETGFSKLDGRTQEVLMGYLPPNKRQFHVLDLGFYSYKEQAWISKRGMLCTHWMVLPEAPLPPPPTTPVQP